MFNNWQKDFQAYERQMWLDYEQNISRINKETFERNLDFYKFSANDEKEELNHGA